MSLVFATHLVLSNHLNLALQQVEAILALLIHQLSLAMDAMLLWYL